VAEIISMVGIISVAVQWSHMEGQLYNIDPEKFCLCLPNSCSDYFPAFLLMVT